MPVPRAERASAISQESKPRMVRTFWQKRPCGWFDSVPARNLGDARAVLDAAHNRQHEGRPCVEETI